MLLILLLIVVGFVFGLKAAVIVLIAALLIKVLA